MNSHSISLVLGHPLPDLKVSLLNSKAYKQATSVQKKKKKSWKIQTLGQSRASETSPFLTALSHFGFIHLNFPAAKWNFLARSLAALWLRASAYEMTRSPWSALKINIPMKHKQIIIIRIKLLTKHSHKLIFSWSHELTILNITRHKTISLLICLGFPSHRRQLPTSPAKLQREDFLHPNHF